jgi:hypothetical protein
VGDLLSICFCVSEVRQSAKYIRARVLFDSIGPTLEKQEIIHNPFSFISSSF